MLAGQSTAIPKTADGAVEMMRQLKVARDSAVKARTTAMNTLKQIVVHAPPRLREALQARTDHDLLTRCARLRPGPIDAPTASAKHTLRALARRWIALTDEIATHDRHLARLTTETSPTLREGFGVGAHTAAELLIIFGDNPDRIRSDAAFAKLCGACPIPASSMTTGRHRLNRGGHRQANAALYRAVIVRMRFHQPTVDYDWSLNVRCSPARPGGGEQGPMAEPHQGRTAVRISKGRCSAHRCGREGCSRVRLARISQFADTIQRCGRRRDGGRGVSGGRSLEQRSECARRARHLRSDRRESDGGRAKLKSLSECERALRPVKM